MRNWFSTLILLCEFFFLANCCDAGPPGKLPLKSVPVGVTRKNTAIPGEVSAESLAPQSKLRSVLMIGGMDGDSISRQQVLDKAEWFYNDKAAAEFRSRMTVSIVPVLHPDRLPAGGATPIPITSPAASAFPPKGPAYHAEVNGESEYLWRWIGCQAPDLVIVLHSTPRKQGHWEAPSAWNNFPFPHEPADKSSLATALMTKSPANMGTVWCANRLIAERDEPREPQQFWRDVQKLLPIAPSAARVEWQRRQARSTLQVCELLAKEYGHSLQPVEYIQAMACIGRIRLSRITGDQAHFNDVQKLVLPFATGKAEALAKNGSGSHIAGHLLFGELARFDTEQQAALKKLVVAAADRAFDANGKPLPAFPGHNEMSDSIFMAAPILTIAGHHKEGLQHVQFMRKLCLRPDGLYRHSPLDEAAWGRGNGFPALGLAWCLAGLYEDNPEHPFLLKMLRDHLRALLPYQDASGMWHQVIDHPESYRELTCTCMIGYAMSVGVRREWLDEKEFQPAIDRAWNAVKVRIADDASLIDVCTGTGKQPNLRAYFDRPAILGKDPRGGAMALLFATELLAAENAAEIKKR